MEMASGDRRRPPVTARTSWPGSILDETPRKAGSKSHAAVERPDEPPSPGPARPKGRETPHAQAGPGRIFSDQLPELLVLLPLLIVTGQICGKVMMVEVAEVSNPSCVQLTV